MYNLKAEYKEFYSINKDAILECEEVFFANDHAYLRKQLPQSWKRKIDNLWYKSPISKIQNGFINNGLMHAELEDLKRDSFCEHNTNKEYWLKSYMLTWMQLPDTLTDDYLFNHLDNRKAFILILKNAYERII